MNWVFLDVERSLTGRVWRDRLDERGAARALAISQRHDLPELLGRVLAGRGVEVEDAARYLDPTVRDLMPDPSLLVGMAEAAARLAEAVTRNETVAILGDYDVDGATSAATLARFLRICGLSPIFIFPTVCSRDTALTLRLCVHWPAAAPSFSSPSIAAPPVTSRRREAA